MGDGGRMMNFVSEKQLDELKEARGARPEDGTVSVDKPLWEILKSNKEAKDAEWQEKHRHKTQKALDEEDVDFLDAVDMHQREQEELQRQVEAKEMAAFQAALLEKQLGTDDLTTSKQSQRADVKQSKLPHKRSAGKQVDMLKSMITVKAQPKKQRVEPVYAKEEENSLKKEDASNKLQGSPHKEPTDKQTVMPGGLLGLQNYGDDVDDEDEA